MLTQHVSGAWVVERAYPGTIEHGHFAHFCAVICVKVPKGRRHFLTYELVSCVLTYGAFLVMINTDAQTVAQTVAKNVTLCYFKKMENDYAELCQRNGYLITG